MGASNEGQELGAATPVGADLGARLAQLAHERGGRGPWRSLEELAADPRSEAWLLREHPERAAEWSDPAARREFLKLMGASLALAGLGACTRQPQRDDPALRGPPEDIVPGEPLYFATAMPWAGGALGLLVESHMGRPTKVEGNPDHPASLGATDVFAQAAVLGLYDPDRSQVTTRAGRINTWEAFQQALLDALAVQVQGAGAGLRILTGSVTSPTLAGLLRETLARFPRARWHQYEAVSRESARAGALAAFGQDVVAQHRLERARVVLSLDADFLGRGPSGVAAARDLQEARARNDCRLYVVESTPTLTGAKADHLRCSPPDELAALAAAVAAASGVRVDVPALSDEASAWAAAAAADARRPALGQPGRRRRGAAAPGARPGARPEPGPRQRRHDGDLHRAARVRADRPGPLAAPAGRRDAGRRGRAARYPGGQPAATTPRPTSTSPRRSISVGNRVHLGLYDDETAGQCHWHVPEAHFLEAWGDARAADGTSRSSSR